MVIIIVEKRKKNSRNDFSRCELHDTTLAIKLIEADLGLLQHPRWSDL